MDFFIGGLAGAGATVFSNPIDVVKTRMQLQGELRAGRDAALTYRNVPHGFYVVAKTDGLLALQKGIAPAMLVGFSMNALRLGTFHIVDVQGWTKNKRGDISMAKTLFWAGISGTVCGLANPFLVLKTRMQAVAHHSIAVGRQHVYKGMVDGFMQMYKAEGMRGFYVGIGATCGKLGIGSTAQLTTFTTAKEFLLSHGICKDNPLALAFNASCLSGIVVSLIACPLDVVSVRLYNQGPTSKSKVLYNGVFDSIRKIYRTEGIPGFYKGMGPFYLRLAPHTTLTLVIWDMLNLIFNRKRKE